MCDILTKLDNVSYNLDMEPSERRERELLERQSLFLDIARTILLKEGYHALTIGRIAQASGFSRGTIYHHFTCKEDLVLALVKRSIDRRLALMERAARFRGRPRERLIALGRAFELFPEFFPDDLRIFFIGNTEAISQRAAKKSLLDMRNSALSSLSIPMGIVRDAIANGDLELQPRVTPEEVAYHFWAMADGAYDITYNGWLPPMEIGILNPVRTVVDGCQILCDGYGWRPLQSEWDYEATRERVRQELFIEEEDALAVNPEKNSG